MSQSNAPSQTDSAVTAPDGPVARVAALASDHPTLALTGILAVLVLVTGLVEPNYLSVSGARNTLLQAAPLGILAGAQTILMLTGGIDLSVTMVATGSAYVAANQSSEGAAVAILLGVLVGLVVGSANGVGVAVFPRQPPHNDSGHVRYPARSFYRLGTDHPAGLNADGTVHQADRWRLFPGHSHPLQCRRLGPDRRGTDLAAQANRMGRLLYAIGDNEVAVRLAGVRVWQVRITAYIVAGVLGSISGILLGGRTGAVDLQLANAFLLPSVAAAVIGGTSIFGGVGGYSGTILGALILSVLNSMLTFLNVGQAIQQVVYGTIVLALAWGYAGLTRRA